MRAAHAIKGSQNNNQLDTTATERERELHTLTELRGGDKESNILGQPGREGGSFGEGGNGVHEDEAEGRGPK